MDDPSAPRYLRTMQENKMNPDFMLEAIRLAERGMVKNAGGPFGAVIVREGKIIGRGCNGVTSGNDPTAHAEVMAIRQACQRRRTFELSGCEIYTSCEPCPMCLAAIYWARIGRIYFANTRRDAAKIGFDDAVFYREIARPPSKRQVPMRQILRAKAQPAFQNWHAKQDKIKY